MAYPLGKKHNPELRRLYEVEGYTLRQIAEHFGVSFQAVHHRLMRMGVPMRPRSIQRQSLERDHLYASYVTDGLTLAEVAAELDTNIYFVRRELIRHGIPRRRTGSRTILKAKIAR